MKLKTKILLLATITSITLSPLYVSAAGNQALLVGRNFGSGNIDTTIDVNNAQSALTFSGKTLLANSNPTISWIKGTNNGTARMESDILYFSGHGNSSLMHFYDANHTSGYDFYITAGTNSSNSVGLSSYTMSQVDLAVFAGCETANGSSNITKTAQTNGAKATLGWIPSIGASSHTNWLKNFWTKVPQVFQISQALTYADSFSYSDSGVKNYNKYGNWNTSLSNLKSSNELFESDDRNNTLSINVTKKNDDEIILEISNWIKKNINDSFNLENYEVNKTIQEDKIIYDLKLLINGDIKTKLGYTVFLYDDTITNIFDNMNDYTAQSLVQTYNTDTRNYSNIIQRANKNINQLTYEIINQKSFKYYDEKENKIYYEVRTELRNRFDLTLTVNTYRVEI